jgi:hypothetical protein
MDSVGRGVGSSIDQDFADVRFGSGVSDAIDADAFGFSFSPLSEKNVSDGCAPDIAYARTIGGEYG